MFLVLLNPEHGGKDPGAVHGIWKEAVIAEAMVKMVEAYLLLHGDGVSCMIRPNGWGNLEPIQRADYANLHDVDYMVTIAVNAGGGTGLEAFISPNAFTKTRQYVNMMVDRLSAWYVARSMPVRGIKEKGFTVLEETAMCSILIETGFIDNILDRSYLTRFMSLSSLVEKIGSGIVDACKSSPNSSKEIQRSTESPGLDKLPFETTGRIIPTNTSSNCL